MGFCLYWLELWQSLQSGYWPFMHFKKKKTFSSAKPCGSTVLTWVFTQHCLVVPGAPTGEGWRWPCKWEQALRGRDHRRISRQWNPPSLYQWHAEDISAWALGTAWGSVSPRTHWLSSATKHKTESRKRVSRPVFHLPSSFSPLLPPTAQCFPI
jgi:hypothetical protein